MQGEQRRSLPFVFTLHKPTNMAKQWEKILTRARFELEDQKTKIERSLELLGNGTILFAVTIPSLWKDEGGKDLEYCIGNNDLEKSIAKAKREFKKINSEDVPDPTVYLHFSDGESVELTNEELKELLKERKK